MKPRLVILLVAMILCMGWACVSVAADVSLSIDVAHPAHRISPRLYGIL